MATVFASGIREAPTTSWNASFQKDFKHDNLKQQSENENTRYSTGHFHRKDKNQT